MDNSRSITGRRRLADVDDIVFLMLTRRQSLGLIGAALALGSCSRQSNRQVKIASNMSNENATIAEIYAGVLERANIAVERRLRLGDEAMLKDALQKGHLDLYPGIAETLTTAMPQPRSDLEHSITSLASAPVNESPCLVTSPFIAEKYWLIDITTCARVGPRLRFAASHEFLDSGVLNRLHAVYGSFEFKSITAHEQGAQYDALARDDADVADGFTTDAKLPERQLIALRDDKRFWPRRNISPIVRVDALRAWPRMRATLDGVSLKLTDYAVQEINRRLDLPFMNSRDVAEAFIAKHASNLITR